MNRRMTSLSSTVAPKLQLEPFRDASTVQFTDHPSSFEKSTRPSKVTKDPKSGDEMSGGVSESRA